MAILEQASVLTDAIRPVPEKELEQRLEKFRKLMDARHPDWEMAVISHKVAMYYFTGTMQEGALIITPSDAELPRGGGFLFTCPAGDLCGNEEDHAGLDEAFS